MAYFSRALNRPEHQYCVTRKELLALVRSVQHFHHHLYGKRFTIRTDHAALKWLLSFRNPEGQVARWIECLQQYDFKIEHRAGAKHGNADALSRRPCLKDSCRHCDRLEEKVPSVVDTAEVSISSLAGHPSLELPRPAKGSAGGHHYWSDCKRPPRPEIAPYSEATKLYCAQWASLRLRDGLVYRLWETQILLCGSFCFQRS